MTMDWGHLAHHLLDGVKAQLAEHEETEFLRRARLVSRHWCHWAAQATTHLKLSAQSTVEVWEEMLNCVVSRFTGMENVMLGGGESFRNLLPLQRAPHLRSLKVVGELVGDALSHLGLLTTLANLELVTEGLCLDSVDTSSNADTLTRLTRLERVALELSTGDECAAKLAMLPVLSDVRLDAAVSYTGIRRLATMPNLVRCALGNSADSITVKETEILGTMTNLVALSIKGCDDADGNGACHLCNLTNLTELDLCGFCTTDSGIEALASLTAISRLCLHCGFKNTDESLRLLQRFPTLSALGLHFADDFFEVPLISNAGFRGIGALTGLVELQVRFGVWGGRWGIQGDDLIGLTPLTCLTALDMVSLKRIGNAHVAHLDSLVMLKRLDMKECGEFDDVGCLSALARLTDLGLSRTRVTGAGFDKLTTLKSLTKLNLQYCVHIADSALEKCAGLAGLEVLDLKGCQGITNAGVMQLRSLRFLSRLEVAGCSHVTIHVERFLREWEHRHGPGL